MINKSIKEYIRLIGMISIPQEKKERIADYIIEKSCEKKEMSGKYVAAASALAFIAVGTYLITRSTRQDINIM